MPRRRSGGDGSTASASAASTAPAGSIFGDEALRFGTESTYNDPAGYDRTYRRRKDDVRFYVALAAAHGGPVLELGAGSGRITLALAREGHDVVALERHAPMRAHLSARLAKEPAEVRARISIVAGDLRTARLVSPGSRQARLLSPGSRPARVVSPGSRPARLVSPGSRAARVFSPGSRPAKLGRRFALVIAPFNVLSHLYTRADWEAALSTVRAHLSPEGRFALDVPMPDVGSFLRNPLTTYRCRPLVDPETGDVLETHESFTYDAASQIQMITSLYGVVGKPERGFTRALAHRHVFPRELEALLHYNGFDVESHEGDFLGGRLTLASESQVVVARLAARASRTATGRRNVR